MMLRDFKMKMQENWWCVLTLCAYDDMSNVTSTVCQCWAFFIITCSSACKISAFVGPSTVVERSEMRDARCEISLNIPSLFIHLIRSAVQLTWRLGSFHRAQFLHRTFVIMNICEMYDISLVDNRQSALLNAEWHIIKYTYPYQKLHRTWCRCALKIPLWNLLNTWNIRRKNLTTMWRHARHHVCPPIHPRRIRINNLFFPWHICENQRYLSKQKACTNWSGMSPLYIGGCSELPQCRTASHFKRGNVQTKRK